MTTEDLTINALAENWNAAPEDEAATPAFWEPYTFTVGDRVVCKPSLECRVIPAEGSPQGDAGDAGHDAWEYGLTGTVEEIDECEASLIAQGHRFMVWWDDIRTTHGRRVGGSVYSAAELEPLSPLDQAGPEPQQSGSR